MDNNGRAYLVVFFFWSIVILATFAVENARAQLSKEEAAQLCAQDLIDGEEEHVGAILWQVNGQCYDGAEGDIPCDNNAGTKFRSCFDTACRPGKTCTGNNSLGTQNRPGPSRNYASCADKAGEPGPSGHDWNLLFDDKCIGGCEVRMAGVGVCLGSSATCYGDAEFTGASCIAAIDAGTVSFVERPPTFCEENPSHPNCVCNDSQTGVQTEQCLCEEDPLIFGDVSVCDDILGGGGGDDGDDGGGGDDGGTDGDGDTGNDGGPGQDPNDGSSGGGSEGGGGSADGDESDNGDGTGGTGQGGGAGGNSENQSESCDPATEACEGGSGRGTYSTCESRPTCSDPGSIECAILQQQWETQCNYTVDVSEQYGEGAVPIWLDPTLADQSLWSDPLEREAALQEIWDSDGWAAGGSCPSIPSVSVAGVSFSFPDAMLCNVLAVLGWAVVAFSAVMSARIVVGGL